MESIAEEEIDGTSAQITVRTDAGKVKVSMNTAAKSDRGFFPQKGEKVTIAVRSENIRFEENKKIAQQSTPNCTSENIQKNVQEPAEKNADDSCDGLTAEVIEKTFAGGQLRVVLKTSECQCRRKGALLFSSYRGSAGRSGRKIRRSIAGSVRSLCRRYPCVSTEQAPYG